MNKTKGRQAQQSGEKIHDVLRHFRCECTSQEFTVSDAICSPCYIIDFQIKIGTKNNNEVKCIQTFVDSSVAEQADINLGDYLQVTGFLFTNISKLSKDSLVEFIPKYYCMNISRQKGEAHNIRNLVTEKLNFVAKNPKYEFEHIAKDIQRRNKLLKSFCPILYQKYDFKLAVILACIGSQNFEDENGSITRGNINLLLYGSLHNGRNDLLNFLNDLFEDSTFTITKNNLKEDFSFGETKSKLGKS